MSSCAYLHVQADSGIEPEFVLILYGKKLKDIMLMVWRIVLLNPELRSGQAKSSALGPGQTSLFSCAEPITIEFDTGATIERCQVRCRT